MLHNPKKHFGQNFLTSVPARIAMVTGSFTKKGDTVVEIGPGKGFLTEELLLSGANVIAVEKDMDLLPLLKEKFAKEVESGQLTLLNDDVLSYDPPHGIYKVVANIPYYITGAIIEKFLSHERKPLSMTLLIQKEVAERIVARDEKESILSLSVKAYGVPKIIHRVGKGSFFPAPKVDSAIIHISNISSSNFTNESEELTYFLAVKSGFAHKRKLLLSNLKEVFGEERVRTAFKEAHIAENERAERVTLDKWLLLSQLLTS